MYQSFQAASRYDNTPFNNCFHLWHTSSSCQTDMKERSLASDTTSAAGQYHLAKILMVLPSPY